jgi:ubiquinone/menaquinone biosynthesis C-methylase UbiE
MTVKAEPRPAGDPHASRAWEDAYCDFETPDQARSKILRRMRSLGAERWPRGSSILDLFCGSGCGLSALAEMGFTRVAGIDLSGSLLRRHEGAAVRVLGDCRELPFRAASHDAVVVHGGLHHLKGFDDLERVLKEVARVLRPEGVFCAVEPWQTFFLRVVRFAARQPLARRASRKLDAFQTMVEHELEAYEHWLAHPGEIRGLFFRHLRPDVFRVRWGFMTIRAYRRRPE